MPKPDRLELTADEGAQRRAIARAVIAQADRPDPARVRAQRQLAGIKGIDRQRDTIAARGDIVIVLSGSSLFQYSLSALMQ